MFKKIAIVTLLASGAVVLAPSQQAEASCKSNWMKLSDAFKKFSPIVAKGICKAFNEDDKDAASKCIADYEKAQAELAKISKLYNEDADGGTIGPRGLGNDRWYEGKLLAERTFIGETILSDEYTVEFKGDGGKSKAPYTVEFCFIDPVKGGAVIEPVSKTFKTNDGKFKRTFKGVAGSRPMVYLKSSKPVGTNANRYKLHGKQGGEPSYVTLARKVVESTRRTPGPNTIVRPK